MGKNKQMAVNLLGQLMVFVSSLAINFLLTPYVVEKLGDEAYGFIGLINNFVSYVSIITVALNALAGRFITLAYHRGDEQEAKEYFVSVFYANALLAIPVFFASVFLTVNAAALLNVPGNLVPDVQLTVLLAFANCILSLLGVVFGVAAFIRNKLYLTSFAQMVAALLRLAIILLAFLCLKPHIWYYSVGAIAATVVTFIIQYANTRHLVPQFRLERGLFRIQRVLTIIKSGVWISLESINKTLQTGLDLLIANGFVGAASMGLLSLAKTIPTVLLNLSGTIANILYPEYARLYAQNDRQGLVGKFRFSIKLLSFLMAVPLIGFMVFGPDFYRLWLPQKSAEDVQLVQLLSALTVLPLLVNAYVEGLYYANTLTNKIRGSVLISFGFSVCSIVIEILLLLFTDLEPLFVIAGTSSCVMILRYIIATPLYCAYVLKLPRFTFYPPLFRSIAVSGVICGLFLAVRSFVHIGSWLQLVLTCGLAGALGYLISFLLLFGKQEKSNVAALLLKKLKK